jgi:hypothetical protein
MLSNTHRHSDESRNLVTFKDTGCRVKHGMTNYLAE